MALDEAKIRNAILLIDGPGLRAEHAIQTAIKEARRFAAEQPSGPITPEARAAIAGAKEELKGLLHVKQY